MIKFKISAGPTKERGKRKHPNGEREMRLDVPYIMVITAPTFQAERSPLKAAAPLNTAPPEQRGPTINRVERKH